MKNENVVCVPVHAMKVAFGLEKQLWQTSDADINKLPYHFVYRKEAEIDFNNKQLIPYAIVKNKSGEILTYQRRGSEKRLSGIWSVGIGGHVNDQDAGTTLYDILLSGLKREFNEEIGIQLADENIQMLGMINEELSEVGHCHTGIVFVVEIDSTAIKLDEEIGNPQWVSVSNIELDRFELWSNLALKLLMK